MSDALPFKFVARLEDPDVVEDLDRGAEPVAARQRPPGERADGPAGPDESGVREGRAAGGEAGGVEQVGHVLEAVAAARPPAEEPGDRLEERRVRVLLD